VALEEMLQRAEFLYFIVNKELSRQKCNVKQAHYMPWMHLGGEEV
jgi:hypothetical protein